MGSRDEVHAALQSTLRRYRAVGLPLPSLMAHYAEQIEGWICTVDYAHYFDRENALPPQFLSLMEQAADQEA